MTDEDEREENARALAFHEALYEAVAKLGVFGVVREAVRLFGVQHPSLTWILFTLVLPHSLYMIVDQYAQESILNTLFPDLPAPPSLLTISWDDFANVDGEKGLRILLFAFLVFLSFCLRLVIVTAVFVSVGCISFGMNVKSSELVGVIPRLWGMWGRLFVTAVVSTLLGLSVGVVYVIFILIFHFTLPGTLLPLLAGIFAVVFLIPLFIIDIMFQVAPGVAGFEGGYGMTALRRAKRILHNKWGSAVLLFILLAIPNLLVGFLLESPVKLTTEFHWSSLVLTIFYVIVTSYLTELTCIAWTMFYISCAIHNKQEAGYEPIGALA